MGRVIYCKSKCKDHVHTSEVVQCQSPEVNQADKVEVDKDYCKDNEGCDHEVKSDESDHYDDSK